jgi:hypothetical protein
VLLGLDEVSVDRLFAQCLARFEAMQTVYEDEAITIAPHQDGCLLSDFQNTLRDLSDGLWFERWVPMITPEKMRASSLPFLGQVPQNVWCTT